jgi:putative zinc-dependent peptidase DUF5700
MSVCLPERRLIRACALQIHSEEEKVIASLQTRRRVIAFACLLSLPTIAPSAAQAPVTNDRIHLILDTSEADQVLAILAHRRAGEPVADSDWQKLFATEPYRRLKAREAAIGLRFHDSTLAFTEADFRRFVLSDSLEQRAPALAATLERWKRAELTGSAVRELTYLPSSAVITAKVFPVIKPGHNSFVWETATNPAIFLYLDPAVGRDKFENTVAHELHHIGLGSLGPVYDSAIARLPERARSAAGWMAAFGEGLAMLAAAGGPDVDPHAASSPEEHARWDRGMANFNADLPAVDAFFAGVLAGKFASQDAIEEKAVSFFGLQGPWYTVGYRMAVIVETRFGRPALIGTMLEFRCLLVLYNRAAAELNASSSERQLPLWSDSVLSGVSAPFCR